jgi:hypothetical protein
MFTKHGKVGKIVSGKMVSRKINSWKQTRHKLKVNITNKI